ncbi:Alpha/Beta hydrolase protein [Apiospora kogelbergensis]|uniref:Alpha/Beta hydrolase protein n=1 Tax=Apiospora kogelbergensis TaxID=1337665 RepID=A0AAW0RE68_9PEZI
MFLTPPTLSFTIPSVHDGHKLDCRLFHPPGLLTPQSAEEHHTSAPPPWARHIAIVAHPYAPLGGSYDDPIVNLVGSVLVQAGFLVATFNFRYCCPHCHGTARIALAYTAAMRLFLRSYCHYQDPPLDSILASFHSPTVHTPAADIRLRAQHLAEQQNKLASTPISPRKSLGMRVGGDEDISSSPRKSHEVRRSRSFEREEKIRKGVKDILGRSKLVRRRRHKEDQPKPANTEADHHEVDCMPVVSDLPKFRSAYLTVSPPIGLMTNLATMSFPNPFGSLSRKRNQPAQDSEGQEKEKEPQNEAEAAELKLVRNPTLAVYGSNDGMAQLYKIREWTTRLKGHAGSQFLDVEINGASHFWWEEGVIEQLRSAINTYATSLVKNGEKAPMHNSALPDAMALPN